MADSGSVVTREELLVLSFEEICRRLGCAERLAEVIERKRRREKMDVRETAVIRLSEVAP